MKAEFFGGPLDGDVSEFLHEVPDKVTTPTDTKSNKYSGALAAPNTQYVHVYKRGKIGLNGVTRLEYGGYGEFHKLPVGG